MPWPLSVPAACPSSSAPGRCCLGWAACLRLAAISLGTHPDPDLFVKELIAEDSAMTCYLVDEVLNVQPPEVREVLLSTSILEHVSVAAAVELTGDEQAAGILAALARTNALVQPIGSGWYRYHTLFTEMLRLRLRHDHPDRMVALHRRAARWYQRNGMLTNGVRHAAAAGDWPLAAAMVVDDLALGQIVEPQDGRCLADEFAGMPSGEAWQTPQPYLVTAAMAVCAGQHDAGAAALNAEPDWAAGVGGGIARTARPRRGTSQPGGRHGQRAPAVRLRPRAAGRAGLGAPGPQ